MRIVFLSVAGLLFFSHQASALRDSIGVKTINGKNFIMHKVTKGEGLYGIGRRYNVAAKDIETANADVKNGVNIGQVILVPYNKAVKNTSADTKKQGVNAKENKPAAPAKMPVAAAANELMEPVFYTVAAGETLFKIARKHGVQVADISKWNNLKGNEIVPGQKLIVGYSKTNSKPAFTEKADGTVAKWQKPETVKDEIKVVDEPLPIKEPLKKTETVQETDEKKESAEGVKTVWKEINTSGVGTWIDDINIGQDKKYALHKTAPVGTVIKLVNPMNGQSAVVKVIGRLPQDETEENVQVKITKSSADKLGLRDKYFRLDMSYGMEVEKKK